MKYIRRDLKLNETINRKYTKNYRHNMNIITFLKSNYKYKRRCNKCNSGSRSCMLQRQQIHKLPVKEAEHAIRKKISFFKTKLSKFLRIFILIMQQATTSINCSGRININCTRMITQIIVQMKVKKTATKRKKKDAIQCDDKDINQNYQAYKDANEDNDSNVDINIIGDEISHQQLNYDKVSTITSTLSRCQRQKHHQIKATPSSSSSSTSSLPSPLITTSVVQENYETCQWSAILRHYIHDDDNLEKPQYHRHHHHHHHRRHLHAMHIKSAPSSTTATTTPTTTSSAASASICQSVDQYVNASWNRSYTMSCLLLTLFIAFTIGVRSTTAGACWQTVLDNGKCNEIFSLNISKSECCGANQEFAYTDREPTNVEYFFATAIGGGMECSPCLESCKNVKCGPNKKCVKRKGRPKCICAPECGAARRRRKQREHIMQQQQHHKLFIDISDANGGVDGAALRDVTAISTPNAFKIKLEKSQQSRDIRSLSSEITNINLGLENSKDVDNGRGLTPTMDRHHHQHKEHNNHQSQRKLIHIHMQQQQQQQQQQQHKSKHKQSNNKQQYTHQQQQQQQQHQPKHKTQEPKGNPRLLITANVEHTEKPTTRRLQIFSNVRTTHARRHNNSSNRNYGNNNNNNHGQDTDPSDYDEEDYEENYNDEDDGADDVGIEDEETKKSTTTTNNNNRNDDATRFSNQSLSRHKLKTKTKPNSSNNNNTSSNSNIKKKNTNYHDLQITKIQQQQQHSSNNTRIRHPNQNGRHAENSPHHRRHHHHHHHNNQQQQQQQQTHHNQQEQQNYGRRKHNKQHHKHQKNNKDYDNNSNNNTMTTTIVGSSTGTTNTLQNSTKIVAAAATKTTATGELSIVVKKTTVLNLSSPLSTVTTSSSSSSSSSLIVSNATPDIQTQRQILSSLNTPVNSTMSAADHRQQHHHHLYPSSSNDLANHGSEIATSSSLPSSSSSSTTSTTTSLLSATSARSASESTLTVTTMSAKGEGVSIHRHHQDLNEITTSSTNNAKTYTALNPHNKQQQQHQTQQQQQLQQQHQTALFDGILDQFDLHGYPNKQHTITNAENVRSTNPVCGTDGRTYNTECQLRKRACRTDNSNLLIAYRGHCKTTCNGVKCLNGLTCVEDQYSMPHCIACKIECPQDDYDNDVVDATRAVCGADGKTYKSTCDINRMICKIGRSIGVAYPGPCREDQVTCDDINCGPKHVCLIDLLTHKPRCTSCRYKCSRKRRPSHLRFEEGKICGVNNRTYNSWCEMRKDSCSTGFYIDVKYSGDCH